MCTNFAEAFANVDTKARHTNNASLHSQQHRALRCLLCFLLPFDTSSLLLNAWHPAQIQANWMQPWLSTNMSIALQLLDQAMPGVNVPSHILSQCKHFMAHDEVHTRRASIVSPHQPVLCTPVQMFTTQLMHQTSHAYCPMQICQPSAGLTYAEAEPEAAAAQEAHLQSFFHKGLYREMLLAPSGDSTAICCHSCYCTYKLHTNMRSKCHAFSGSSVIVVHVANISTGKTCSLLTAATDLTM